MTLTAGDRLGPYEIVGPLAADGQGEVYRANDTNLKRQVAIKVLPQTFAHDPSRLARFQREVEVLAALNHRSIAHVYGLERQQGREELAGLVMELVEGPTLEHLIARRAVGLREALNIARQTAEALEFAHEHGIVHRDLKPANIKVREDDTVKILDFGFAEAIESSGTAAYVSPEQARRDAVDRRTDIWSFGVILFEMLTGQRLFAESSAAETLAAVLREPIDFGRLPKTVPVELRELIERCLERDPKKRQRDIGDARLALERVNANARDLTGWRSQRRLLIATVSCLLAGVLAGLFFARWQMAPPPITFERLTFPHGHFTSARFGPDGQTIFMSPAWEGKPPELLQLRPGIGDLPLGISGDSLLSVSKSGELAILIPRLRTANPYFWRGRLAVVPATGGTPREVTDDVDGADWSPDGKSLAILRTTPSESRLEYPVGTVLYQSKRTVFCPRLSPRGDAVAFFELQDDKNFAVMRTTVGGATERLSEGWFQWWDLAWSPDGSEIWFGGAKKGAAASLYAVNTNRKVRTLLTAPGTLELQDVWVDGRVLVSRIDVRNRITGIFHDGTRERDLTWLEPTVAVDLSDDGSRLLLSSRSERDAGTSGVLLRTTDGAVPQRLGDGLAQELSPDGHWALTARDTQLIALPIGPGRAKTISVPLAGIAAARWFPDNHRVIAAGEDVAGVGRLVVADFDGPPSQLIGDPFSLRVLVPGERQPLSAVSADGRWIAAAERSGGIAIVTLPSGARSPLTNGQANDLPIQFSADGKELFLYDPGEIPGRVFKVDLASGKRELFREFQPPDRAGVYGLQTVLLSRDAADSVFAYQQNLSDLYLVRGLR